MKARTPLEKLDMDLIKTPQSAIMSVEIRKRVWGKAGVKKYKTTESSCADTAKFYFLLTGFGGVYDFSIMLFVLLILTLENHL